MRFVTLVTLACAYAFANAACASDSDPVDENDPPITERGGPHGLGGNWVADPATINGIELQLGLSFTPNSLTARNTCEQSLTAMITVPAKYKYTATIPSAGRGEADGDSCFVEIAAGSFDFEIVNNKLEMTYQGQSYSFDPAGGVAGLYGEWEVEAPNVGTLRWRMGGGKIRATVDCDNGSRATVAVNAQFVNKIELPQGGEDVRADGEGLECSARMLPGVVTYRFDGDILVLTSEGQDLRLRSN